MVSADDNCEEPSCCNPSCETYTQPSCCNPSCETYTQPSSESCQTSLCSVPCCQPCEPCCDNRAYFKFSGGATFPIKPNVCAPVGDVWDPAVQGYNSKFRNRVNFGIAFGCEVGPSGAVEVSATYRGQFKYKKFQTVPAGAISDLQAKTRRFNLESMTAMGSLFFYGRYFDCLTFNCGSFNIYPVIGAGFGMSRVLIWDFRSTGLPSVDKPLLAFSSENEYTVRWKFAYQMSGGLEFRYCECWAIGVSYRWFDAGRLSGPRYFRDTAGNSFDAGQDTWQMSLKANEVVGDIKYIF